MQEISLSVGYLQKASQLIQIINDNPGADIETIEEIVSKDDIIIRNISEKIIFMSINIGWIVITENNSVSLNKNIKN